MKSTMRRRAAVLLAAFAWGLAAGTAGAVEKPTRSPAAPMEEEQKEDGKPVAQPSPGEQPQQVQQIQEAKLPWMGQMMAVMLRSMAKALAEKEIAENLATFARNYYSALVSRGFSEEEAMKIVVSTGWPNVGGKQ